MGARVVQCKGGLMSQGLRRSQAIGSAMHHGVMVALAVAWIACNFWLWSMKQSHLVLFLQSLGMAAIAYPALYFYVTREK
jgi:hypothetical protein